jgi:hypothetical protein
MIPGVILLASYVPVGNTYNPAAGSYSHQPASGNATYTISCSASVVWNWSASGGTGTTGLTSNVATGGSATSITLTLAQTTTARNTTVTVTSGGFTWTLTLATAASSSAVVATASPSSSNTSNLQFSAYSTHSVSVTQGGSAVTPTAYQWEALDGGGFNGSSTSASASLRGDDGITLSYRCRVTVGGTNYYSNTVERYHTDTDSGGLL